MEYLNDVRIAFLHDASASPDSAHGDFRSPAMDYFMWLDHTVGGFHAQSRKSLEKSHGITFEALQNGMCQDIFIFFDWVSYHNVQCKDHDFCGAVQGCGGGEDIQHFLHSVNVHIDAPNAPEKPSTSNDTTDPMMTGNSSSEMVTPSNPFPPFPLPFNIDCRKLALSTLGGYARQMLIGGLDYGYLAM
ncbi:hypothetical protein DEU56DRAFT_919608 [Suillus clintonianus]|uniref:uncharacterized protein n=1 Tax=Suillus clintonianus TaxID=1904413 RepID=UPI001B85EDC9|nr:uncharacterized protein DEU56DRAFT_919608 [Suillus clintonianus]KAG2114399.1 hypothetical protein DEU56DRAFT_919608 [Suillus clintonianus]